MREAPVPSQDEPSDLSELPVTTKAEGRMLLFWSPLPRPPQSGFFVWPESSLESPIIDVTYSHRALNPRNHWIGSKSFLRAGFDEATRQWFVPISEIFSNSSELLHPLYFQEISLLMRFKDGTVATVKIIFKMASLNVR